LWKFKRKKRSRKPVTILVKETDAKKKGKKKLYITISQLTSSQNPKYKTIRKKKMILLTIGIWTSQK